MFSYVSNGHNYDFGVFENFEVTKQNFIKERKMIKHLKCIRRRYKTNLVSMHQHILRSYLSCLNTPVSSNIVNHKVAPGYEYDEKGVRIPRINISKECFIGNERNSIIFDYNYSLNALDILNRGKRGLILLQETYDLEFQELVERIFSNSTSVYAHRKDNLLSPDDLLSMSNIAITDFKWIQSGLNYLIMAFYLLNAMPMRHKNLLPRNFGATLESMKTHISAHNELLFDNHIMDLQDWKYSPYPNNKGFKKLGFGSYVVLLLLKENGLIIPYYVLITCNVD